MQIAPKNFYKKLLGRNGELKAVNHLKRKGYKILDKNYQTPFGEADIICSYNGEIVFVEVKTRTSDKFGLPKEAVDSKKQEKYRKIASYYILTNKLEEVSVSFLVVEILKGQINVIENAF